MCGCRGADVLVSLLCVVRGQATGGDMDTFVPSPINLLATQTDEASEKDRAERKARRQQRREERARRREARRRGEVVEGDDGDGEGKGAGGTGDVVVQLHMKPEPRVVLVSPFAIVYVGPVSTVVIIVDALVSAVVVVVVVVVCGYARNVVGVQLGPWCCMIDGVCVCERAVAR